MKKLMKIFMVLALMIPMLNVNALTITDCSVGEKCFVYSKGDRINFYKSAKEAKDNPTVDAGIATIAVEDPGKGSRYVKVIAYAPYRDSIPYVAGEDTTPGSYYLDQMNAMIDSFGTPQSVATQKKYAWKAAKWTTEQLDQFDENGDYIKGGRVVVEMPSKQDYIDAFNGTQNADGSYKLDSSRFTDDLIEELALEDETLGIEPVKKLYTKDYNETTNKIWVVDLDYTVSGETVKLNGATLKEITLPGPGETDEFAALPIVYMDKTYECHDRYGQEEYACYECGEDYRWVVVGKQEASCKLIGGITSKSKCVKTVKTGAEDYLVEFFGIATVCGVALVIAKRKDLFKAI